MRRPRKERLTAARRKELQRFDDSPMYFSLSQTQALAHGDWVRCKWCNDPRHGCDRCDHTGTMKYHNAVYWTVYDSSVSVLGIRGAGVGRQSQQERFYART